MHHYAVSIHCNSLFFNAIQKQSHKNMLFNMIL